jgi:hypothetical protein
MLYKLKKNIICSVCKKEFKVISSVVQHYSRYHSVEDRINFYCSFYGYPISDLKYDYLELEKGLRSISREKKIPYIVLKYLVDYLKITRSQVEAIRLQNDKNKLHFLDRYGVENPFQIKEVIHNIQKKNKKNIDSINAKRKETFIKRYGVDNPSKIPAVINKLKNKSSAILLKSSTDMKDRWKDSAIRAEYIAKRNQAILAIYGVDNVFKLPAIKDKIKETIYRKYGVYNIAYSNYKRALMIAQGHWLPKEKRSEYANYKLMVQQETRKWAKELVEGWMLFFGTCYYTGEDLLLDQGRGKQPSIDHKISMIYGYRNNISPEKIGHSNNLCVCSFSINAIKNFRTEEEFYKSSYSKLTLQGLFA